MTFSIPDSEFQVSKIEFEIRDPVVDLNLQAALNMTDIQPGRYRHYKGNEYTVIGVARHSETQEELVVYRQEYGDHGLWVRPKTMFAETVTIGERSVARFQRISD